MNQKNKFLFDLNNFDTVEDEAEEIIEEEIEVEPPPPTFSEDDLEAARATAHANGVREGIAEERERREQKTAELLEKIADNFSSLFAAEQYRERQYEEEAVRLTLETINIALPALTPLIGTETLKTVIADNLKKQSDQSEIIIELHPDDIPPIKELLTTLWKEGENAPRYKIIENENTEKGACSLSWADGGLVRDPAKTTKAIRDELQSLLTKPQNNAIKEEEDSSPKPDESNGE